MKIIEKTILQRVRKTPLEVKILTLIIFCLLGGFGTYVIYSIQSESVALKNQHRQRANLFGETLISGIRNIMVSGRAPYVRAFVNEAREEFKDVGEIHLFNNQAEEIFQAQSPHITIPIQDKELISYLKKGTFSDEYYPLKNETSCRACHNDESDNRGTIKLDFIKNTDWDKALLEVVNSAFQAIMLSGKGEFGDTLLLDINKLLGVNLVQVYDSDAIYVAFGNDKIEINEIILEDVVDKIHASEDYMTIRSIDKYNFSPLPNLGACYVCHGSDSPLRGILAMEVSSGQVQREQVIKSVVIGFKNLMRLKSASYAGAYIDAIRELPYIKNFQIFDNGEMVVDGYRELWVPNPEYESIVLDTNVANLIAKKNHNTNYEESQEGYIEKIVDVDHLTQMIAIVNDEKCQACHQSPKADSPLFESQKDIWKVRSVVKVSTSMKDIQEEIQKNIQASIIVGLITLILMAYLLSIFMRFTVLNPLEIIGKVADKIGAGDLSVHARVKAEDEIGMLANRINAMIKGLQERLHLTKFVSDEALTAVEKADLQGLDLGGKRREATVLFSDIRGFTSFSEKMEPEEVINLLNTYFDKQTEIVKYYDGDIDKFVGDELMAVFTGEGMVDSAINSAIKIQKEVQKLNRSLGKNIGIGIGINAGHMVMGAMGSKERMDFTVIGDNVNLGSRLCDVAKAGEIILSEKAKNYIISDQFKLVETMPIMVKGKENPIDILKVII